jgi:ATPase subunit of ABC transporter with duplicated ATPase domains
LDWPALLWLEKHLLEMDGVVLVIVSHDRAFLDVVATDITRLARGGLQHFVGNYSEFEDALAKEKADRAQYAAQREAKIEIERKKVRKMEEQGRKNDDAKMLSQVSSRKKKLGIGTSHGVNRVGMTRGTDGKKFSIFTAGDASTLDDGSAQVSDDDKKPITLPAASNPGFAGPLLQCRAVRFGWSAAAYLSQPFDLDVSLSSRIAILGANGTGKSTFLKTVAGQIPPLAGEVYSNSRLSIAYFSQHISDAFDLELSPVQTLKSNFAAATEQEIRAHLGSFGVRSQATVPLAHLSGGEKTRVALATITFKPPHILLLDEPTNHLDLNTVAALGEGLKAFKGGIVLVSHDRRLLKEMDVDCYLVDATTKRFEAVALDAFLRQAAK